MVDPYTRMQRFRERARQRKESGEEAWRQWAAGQFHDAESLKAIQKELRRRKRSKDWSIPGPADG